MKIAVLTVVTLVLAGSGVGAFAAGVQFQEYPVDSIYRGKPHFPQFSERDKSYRMFRTRIVDGIKGGANFAG